MTLPNMPDYPNALLEPECVWKRPKGENCLYSSLLFARLRITCDTGGEPMPGDIESLSFESPNAMRR
jgi:hypothetical protein